MNERAEVIVPFTIVDFLYDHGQGIDSTILRRFMTFFLGEEPMSLSDRLWVQAADASVKTTGKIPLDTPSWRAEVRRQLRWWSENDPSTFAMMTLAPEIDP